MLMGKKPSWPGNSSARGTEGVIAVKYLYGIRTTFKTFDPWVQDRGPEIMQLASVNKVLDVPGSPGGTINNSNPYHDTRIVREWTIANTK